MFLHCVSCINCLALAIAQTLDTKMFYCKDKDEAKVINYTELWPLPNEWPLLPWRSRVNQSIPCFTVGCQHLSSKPISSHTLIFDMLYIYYCLFCRSLLSKITCFSHIVNIICPFWIMKHCTIGFLFTYCRFDMPSGECKKGLTASLYKNT